MFETSKMFEQFKDKNITELLKEFNSKEMVLDRYFTAVMLYFELKEYLSTNQIKDVTNYNELMSEKNNLHKCIQTMHNTMFV